VRLRPLLAVIFLLGSLGLAAELLLLSHFEQPAQLIPLVLLALGVAALAWSTVRPTAAATSALRIVAALQVVAGLIGMALHLQSNVEFAREMHAEIAGVRLAWEALTGAIPALAPGALLQLGLIGLAYTIQE
jgi:hypothetical protein